MSGASSVRPVSQFSGEPPFTMRRRAPAPAVPIRRHVGMRSVRRFVKVPRPLGADRGRQLPKSLTGTTPLRRRWGRVGSSVNRLAVDPFLPG